MGVVGRHAALVGVCIIVAAAARAGDGAEGTEAASADPCAGGGWRLEGAAVQPGPEATFKPDWHATLATVERCLDARPDACVRVRGHYDATAFDPSVVHAFGSEQAAQLARARGRSEQAVARLYDLGVEGWRLQHVPPPMAPSWRGVSLTLVERCRPVPPAAPPSAAPEPPPEPPAATIESPPRATAVAVVERDGGPLPLALLGALGGDVLAVEGAAEWSGRLRLGIEWQSLSWYAHLGGGVTLSGVDARARGGDVLVGAGHRLRPWLALGLYATVGQGSTGFTDGWMHRTWAVGVEVAECYTVYPGGRICAEQRLSPLGRRAQRALIIDDITYLIPQESDPTMGLALTVGFRQQL